LSFDIARADGHRRLGERCARQQSVQQSDQLPVAIERRREHRPSSGCGNGWLPNRCSRRDQGQARRTTLIGLNRSGRQRCTIDSIDVRNKAIMVQPHAHLGYAPRGVGLLYAVFWFANEDDILGWFIGTRDGEQRAAYFVLPDYYSSGRTTLLHSVQDDMYGPWVEAAPDGDLPLPHPPPVPEALRHELVRLQDQFIRHWLFFADDPESHAEAEALAARELAVGAVGIRAARLGKLRTAPAVWRYDAPGADLHVLIELSKRWPLDHRVEA
jgi:hypothetical protein